MSTAVKQCNPGNADLFFQARKTDEAAELCLDCLLMIQCRDLARDNGELHGVWGGETAEERIDWLINNHPDPAVRNEAQVEKDALDSRREASRLSKARKRASNGKRVGPPVVSHATARQGADVQQERAYQRALKAWQMQQDGLTRAEIARELGLSERSVKRYLGAKYANIAAA